METLLCRLRDLYTRVVSSDNDKELTYRLKEELRELQTRVKGYDEQIDPRDPVRWMKERYEDMKTAQEHIRLIELALSE